MAKGNTKTFETELCGELIVEANERLREQSSGKKSCSPPPSKGICAPGTDAVLADVGQIRPCFELRWGDGPKDQLETDDTEVLHIVARNPHSNVILKDVTIVRAEILYEGGPVHRRPDGTPSVELTPSGFIFFGDLPPCDETSNTGAGIVREVSLVNKGAKPGDYSFSFKYCHSVEFIRLARDKLQFEVVRRGCRRTDGLSVVRLAIVALLALLLCLICSAFLIFWMWLTRTYIYSPKYVCVPEVAGPSPQLSPSIPIGGSFDYKTVVNVHNYPEEVIRIQQQVAAPNDPSSMVTQWIPASLEPNHVLEMHCLDIASALGGAETTSATGFLIIESPAELDVVAIYTSAFYGRESVVALASASGLEAAATWNTSNPG